ncbi:MAG TPA: acyl-CoA dehydrogenase family protein [Polyangiaceae bacterium]|jgi:alkylation response protein AidB-like acyl-CoA dehydrogenase|nr:acyl-CoA dehydrogenase family protein [Polyangiaceae bacterium]
MNLALAKLELGTVEELGSVLSTLLGERHLELPLPGRGFTRERFDRLLEFSAVDLSLGRLVEGHTDAHAILAEADHERFEGKLYGVWAAEPPGSGVAASRATNGFRLCGLKRFCSGARTLDRALVTANSADGALLFDVDVRAIGVRPLPGTWPAVGMANSDSLDVHFDLEVPGDAQLGSPRFYVERPGFWQGSVGVAACWLGGAVGCARMLKARFSGREPDDHVAAHLGAIIADVSAMRAVFERAANEIDAAGESDPDGFRRALTVRQVVEQGCQRVLTATGRASGTGPLVFDAQHARRAADLAVYLRQHHAEHDAATLARASLESDEWP